MSTYTEMLRDPRWQRKRLEVMQRDGFACRACSSTTKTLNVHHNLYFGHGHPPWQYPDQTLITLCEDCHAEEEALKKHMDGCLVMFFRQGGALNSDVHRICTMVNEITERPGGLAMIQHVLSELWDEQRKK